MISDNDPGRLTDEDINFEAPKDIPPETQSSEPELTPEVLAMYEIPGHGEITTKALARYQSDKRLYEDEIKRQADLYPSIFELAKIRDIPELERAELIEKALQSGSPSLQLEGASMIYYVPEPEQARLQQSVAEIIKQAFQSSNPEAHAKAAEMISYVHGPERISLGQLFSNTIEKTLQSGTSEAQANAAEIIWLTSESKQSELIREAIESGNPEAQLAAVNNIKFVPEKDQIALKQFILETVKDALQSDDPEAQAAAAKMIWAVPKPEHTGLMQLVQDSIEKGFQSGNPKFQTTAAEMIRYAPYSERTRFIKVAIQSNNPDMQREAGKAIRYAPEPEQAKLANLAEGTPAANGLVASRLYRDQVRLSNRPLARKKFNKSGSESFLLGGGLIEEVIIRRIEDRCFLAWQNTYENYGFWRDEGFDYVPVEPIVSFKSRKDGMVDVYTGVLDLSLANYQSQKWSKFGHELEEDRSKIRDALVKLGIAHGHDHHTNNFCLRFFRDENGFADLNRKPRIYVIDFDQAVTRDPSIDN